ncbi:MAG: hypothetical protein RIQ94_2641 [Pseudomonadota bacterium]|jgi:hypothetical protein
MTSKKETIEIIEKLIELTQHNQIIWQSQPAPRYMCSPDSRIDLVYETEYLGRYIRLYQKQFKYYIDENQYTWDENMIFEIVDDQGNTIWEFPRTPNAYELLKAVQFQNPQVSNFYNDLFKK